MSTVERLVNGLTRMAVAVGVIIFGIVGIAMVGVATFVSGIGQIFGMNKLVDSCDELVDYVGSIGNKWD